MKPDPPRVSMMLLAGWVLLLCAGAVGVAQNPTDQGLGLVRVGTLVYAQGKTAQCFSDGFLGEVARTTGINVDRRLNPVRLDSDEIYQYPFLIMAGTGEFELTRDQRDRLGKYLKGGGFLLASAGCSDAAWATSFRALVQGIFGQDAIKPIGLAHPIFHMVFEVERLTTRKASVAGEIYGVRLGGGNQTQDAGRLAIVFSPTGLNDTDSAGGGCCCCGGNEFLDAKRINANLLVYTLTH